MTIINQEAQESIGTGTGYNLPFYLVQTYRINWRFFNPFLNEEYKKLVLAEKDNTLREKYPKYDRPLAAMFVNKAMIEDSLWSNTDAEGNLATNNPELAAYVLLAAQKKNPKARMHKYSKQLTQDELKKAGDMLPTPMSFNLKPKDVLNVAGKPANQIGGESRGPGRPPGSPNQEKAS